MTTCFLAPDPIQSTFFIPGGNTVANGGQLFFYAAGSSTKQTVFKDNAGATAWTNPIVLDSGGNLPSGGEVWFVTGQTYKVIFAPSTDTDPPASPYWTKDNLAGINDTGSATTSEWTAGPSPTFVNATQFTVVGDQTGTFTAGRRLKTTNTAGTVYGVIASASFGTSTTVNVVTDSGALDSGLSAVSYGILDPANPSMSSAENNRKGASVASAGTGTTNIWGTAGDFVHITGTNSIYNFSNAPYAGVARDVVFDGSLTLFSSSALQIPQGINLITRANDRARIRADSVSTSIVENYTYNNVGFTIGQFSASLTSNAQAIVSTVGFKPGMIVWLGAIQQSTAVSVSVDDTKGGAYILNSNVNGANNWQITNTSGVLINQNSSGIFKLFVISTDSNGFTWSSNNNGSTSGGGVATIVYAALR